MTTNQETLVSLNDQNSSDWEIAEAVLNSSRAFQPFNIKNVITDIEIYEHIANPYITGSFVMTDTERVVERFDIQGAETFTLRLQTAQYADKPIEKTFFIDTIQNLIRGNETSQVTRLHFTEDIGYKSALYNVNKSYFGEPEKIVATIASDYFKKEVISSAEKNVANAMKVIIPNLDPLEAMEWVKNRSTTAEGYPFYLFSNFATNRLFFVDLGSMLSQPAINEKFPYMYSQSNASVDNANRMQKIYEYGYSSQERTFDIMKAGFVGAQHSWYDITTATYVRKQFSVHKDLYDKAENLNPRQNRPVISYDHIIDEKPISEYNSRQLFNTYASKNFVEGKSYGEEPDEGQHTRKVVSLAMKELLAKNPIEIVIDGREFLTGGESKSIGNIIKVIFKATDHGHSGQKIDRRLSGDYLIVAARHTFTKEKCRSKLLISKISNYNSDIYTQGPDQA